MHFCTFCSSWQSANWCRSSIGPSVMSRVSGCVLLQPEALEELKAEGSDVGMCTACTTNLSLWMTSLAVILIQKYIISAADIECIAGFMTQLGVCLSRRSTSAACRSLGVGSRYRSIAVGTRAAVVGNLMFRAKIRGSTQTCYNFQWSVAPHSLLK